MNAMFLSVTANPTPADRFLLDIAWVDGTGDRRRHLIDRVEEGPRPRRRPVGTRRQSQVQSAAAAGDAPERESLETAAAAVLDELSRGDRVVYTANLDDVRRVFHMFAQVGQSRPVALADVSMAFSEACLPLYACLPSPRSPGWDLAQRRVVRTAIQLVERCRTQVARDEADTDAMSGAMRLWRTWRAITQEAERLASFEEEE